MQTNYIPVSQLQKGDKVEYKYGSHLSSKQRFFAVTDIKDMHNGLIRIYCGRRNTKSTPHRTFDVRRGSEVRILV